MIILEDGYTFDIVKPAFVENLKVFFAGNPEITEVRYAEIGSALINTEGVLDYKNLLINGGALNIPVGVEYVPVVSEDRVTFT